MKTMRSQFLLLLAMLMMAVMGAKAGNVLYAVVSDTDDDGDVDKLVIKWGVAENGSWKHTTAGWKDAAYLSISKDIKKKITSVTIDESCKSCTLNMMAYIFSDMQMTTITGLANLNTSNATSMRSMFMGCQALTSLDLSTFDTSNVTDMYGMFYLCKNIRTLDLTSFNTAKVSNMLGMFADDELLEKVFVSDDWNTDAVGQGTMMFDGCTSIVGEDGTTFNSADTNKSKAHFGEGGYLCSNYLYGDADNTARLMEWNNCHFSSVKIKGRTLEAGKWNALSLPFTLGADHIAASFPEGTKIMTLSSYANDGTDVPIGFAEVMTIKKGQPYLVFIPEGEDITDPVFRNVIIQPASVETCKNVKGDATFIGTYAPVVLPPSTQCFYVLNNKLFCPRRNTTVKPFYAYFTLANPLPTKVVVKGIAIEEEVIDDTEVLYAVVNDTDDDGDVDKLVVKWGVAEKGSWRYYPNSAWGWRDATNTAITVADREKITSVTIDESCKACTLISMAHLFRKMQMTTITGLANLNTGNATSMQCMFTDCQALTSLDLSAFDTSKVLDMLGLFAYCSELETIDVSAFNTMRVTDMSAMFSECVKLTTIIGLDQFNTHLVEDMSDMFGHCEKIQTLDLTSFNTARVLNMKMMFYLDELLEKIYVGDDWNTETVSSSTSSMMFQGCSSLVGGAGTTYDSHNVDKFYAHVDEGTSDPGYLRSVTPGDADGDGVVDVNDVTTTINHILGKPVANFIRKAANVDGDTSIDVNDVQGIIDIALGKK